MGKIPTGSTHDSDIYGIKLTSYGYIVYRLIANAAMDRKLNPQVNYNKDSCYVCFVWIHQLQSNSLIETQTVKKVVL